MAASSACIASPLSYETHHIEVKRGEITHSPNVTTPHPEYAPGAHMAFSETHARRVLRAPHLVTEELLLLLLERRSLDVIGGSGGGGRVGGGCGEHGALQALERLLLVVAAQVAFESNF